MKNLIPCSNIHDVTASDDINGKWHKGFRRPDSQTVAFYHLRQWWASQPNAPACIPCPSKLAALNA